MISFCFVGDYCPAGRTSVEVGHLPLVCAECRRTIDKADLAIANLESCLVEDGTEREKFIAIPESECGPIAKSGFDVFTLANNHILDCGEQSLLFARSYLRRAGIRTVGAAEDIESADAPLLIEQDGKRIAIFSATDATHYSARRNRAGISPLRPRRLKKAVRELRSAFDIVIVCIHSDLEFTNYPAPWKVRLSRQLSKAGADLVVHHHPHTLQGIETRDGSLIAYSLGNFVFPVHGRKYMENKEGDVDESAILQVDLNFSDDGSTAITHKIIPIVIGEDNVTRIAEESQAESITAKMVRYSGALENPEFLRRHYFDMCRIEMSRFVKGTYYGLRKDGIRKAYEYVRIHLRTAMHRNWLRGFLTLGHY